MITGCPGASRFKQPIPESLLCRFCGEDIEIWSDEFEVICPKCKKKNNRQMLPTCLEWCKFAKECVGETIYQRFLKSKKGG
jgi:ribosomal protein L24E